MSEFEEYLEKVWPSGGSRRTAYIVVRAGIVARFHAAVEAEREACARVCEQDAKHGVNNGGWIEEPAAELARRIRARGERT